MQARRSLCVTVLEGFPIVEPHDDLPDMIIASLAENEIVPRDMDVLVVAQKIVSKAEGRYVDLDGIVPSSKALDLAAATGKDARFLEVVLSESTSIVRTARNLVITEHRLGYVMANAGIDQSNISQEAGERVLLLPADPDGFCDALGAELHRRFGVVTGVIMSDSFGRPWRIGTIGVAIGCSRFPPLVSMIGKPDLFGRSMRMTEIAMADQVAAAATLLMGETNEATPVVHMRGLEWSPSSQGASALFRPREQDLFRQ